MRRNVWRGLKKWKGDSYFQLVPVLSGGGVDLMQMAPSAAAGAVLDFLTPERLRKTQSSVPPVQSESVLPALTVGDISDPVESGDPTVESRIFYVNGDLDMIIEVRNYNQGVSIKDMSSKEFLQLLTSAVDVSGVEEGRTTAETCVEVF